MKKETTTLGHFLYVLDHIIKLQIRFLYIIVAVLAYLKPSVGHDGYVITPCWIWHVDMLVSSLPK